MMNPFTRYWTWIALLCLPLFAWSQTIRGVAREENGTPIFGLNVVEKGTNNGVSTDFDGKFQLKPTKSFPVTLLFSGLGYVSQELVVNSARDLIQVKMETNNILLQELEVSSDRITEKQKEAPLTVESMDVIAIQQTASVSFYEGLGNLKGVDLTSASLGFKVINTRGFNSTSPVRSLQLIDGVDNMSPGLNFSLGNFLGSSELDIMRVDLVQGASSAYYGPNAFNGVIDMTTKSPFDFTGLTLQVKGGERNLLETAVRWAWKYQDKKGRDRFAYKVNFFYLRADDWEARNYGPATDSKSGIGNPGGFDAVNIYGDEGLSTPYDFNTDSALRAFYPGLGVFYRDGYREEDLVDYNTRNIKANVALHYRTKSEVEFVASSNFGSGTTVYHGENRYSLKDILFFQNRFEVGKKDRWFIRAYATHEDAGNSYDAVVTAFLLQNNNRPLGGEAQSWNDRYSNYWFSNIANNGFGQLYNTIPNFPTLGAGGLANYNFGQADALLAEYYDSLLVWHQRARNFANEGGVGFFPYFQPGSFEFDTAFAGITSRPLGQGGSRFVDRSALYQVQGEYKWRFRPWEPTREVSGMGKLVRGFTRFVSTLDFAAGGSFRLYTPNSQGTIFIDTGNVVIRNWQVGGFLGVEKRYEKVKINLATRFDKNENFPLLISPAASVVYIPHKDHTLRFSASSAIRNPTLADQFLNYNVGRAILRGNLEGFDSLVTVPSVEAAFSGQNIDLNALEYFRVDPVKPEEVRTLELGYRGIIKKKLYIDASYYYSWYTNFIGYKVGVDLDLNPIGLPTSATQVYRVATNSVDMVTTQGASVQANYYFAKYLSLNGNYSWNVLDRQGSTDPLIPAFNTPAHKFNVGIDGRDIKLRLGKFELKNWGFGVNFKWIEGFLFEGSPQFTGTIPSYYMVDAQLSYSIPKAYLSIKVGAQNLTDNRVAQVYGGPLIGRLIFASVTFDHNFLKKKK